METQELLDWLDENRVYELCGLEEAYHSLHFLGTSCCVEVDEDLFERILAEAEPHERQQRLGEICVRYPVDKLKIVVVEYLRLPKLLALLED